MNKKKSPAKPDFHHVVLSVDKVDEMPFFRVHQTIVASVSIKMSIEDAKVLHDILAKKLEEHKEGAGPITFSLEGKFT